MLPVWYEHPFVVTAITLVITLTITFIFNMVTGLPKKLRKQRAVEQLEKERQAEENRIRDQKISVLETAVASLPGYRAQSIQIQQQLQTADTTILATCQQIQAGVAESTRILNARLDKLEKREKNAIREKILREYRLMCSDALNEMHAWSEMEAHAFFALVRDYEELGGNDYVHSVVLPAVNELEVIPMTDVERLAEMFRRRDQGALKQRDSI
jgi:predicted nucleic acid-binding protein